MPLLETVITLDLDDAHATALLRTLTSVGEGNAEGRCMHGETQDADLVEDIIDALLDV